jgi:hypothetical protein
MISEKEVYKEPNACEYIADMNSVLDFFLSCTQGPLKKVFVCVHLKVYES